MTAVTKILTGAAGLALAAGAFATPAQAQYYPGNPYGYGQGQGGVVGQVLESILGTQRYANNDRYAIDMCVRSAEARLNGGYGAYGQRGYGGGYGGYGNQGYGGYGNQGYNQYGGARVVRITHIERRSNGGLKVFGLADSPRNNYGGYNQGYGGGYGGYGNQGYGGGYGNYGYGNQGYMNTTADYRFNCKIDRGGRVTDIDIDRNNRRRGY